MNAITTPASLALFALLSGTAFAGDPEPDSRFTIMLGGSFTGAGDVESIGALQGEVEIQRYQIEAGWEIPFSSDWSFQIGGKLEHVEIDQSLALAPLPDSLAGYSLDLGATWRISDRWAAGISASPGFYGDDEVDTSDAFNVPFRLFGRWQQSSDLAIIFGLRVDAFSDSAVMPILRADWEISDKWNLTLGVPRTELRYQWSDRLSLFGAVAMEGGSYAVDSQVMDFLGRPLRDTYVSESEMRGLVGFDYSFTSGLKLGVEAGYAFERQFDYHERSYELDVDSGPFARMAVSFSF